MSNKIKHSGIIESVENDCVHVRILQSSACAGCKVAGHCSASESKEKMVDITDANASNYKVGESVTISTENSTGFRAVLYGYGYPLILLMAALMIVGATTKNELYSALAALEILVPYYLIIYVMRNKISRQVYFTIEK